MDQGPLNLLSGLQLSQVTGLVGLRDFFNIFSNTYVAERETDFGDFMDYKLQLTTFHCLIVSVTNTYNYMQI